MQGLGSYLGSAHEHHGGTSIGQRGGIAGGDGPALLQNHRHHSNRHYQQLAPHHTAPGTTSTVPHHPRAGWANEPQHRKLANTGTCLQVYGAVQVRGGGQCNDMAAISGSRGQAAG